MKGLRKNPWIRRPKVQHGSSQLAGTLTKQEKFYKIKNSLSLERLHELSWDYQV